MWSADNSPPARVESDSGLRPHCTNSGLLPVAARLAPDAQRVRRRSSHRTCTVRPCHRRSTETRDKCSGSTGGRGWYMRRHARAHIDPSSRAFATHPTGSSKPDPDHDWLRLPSPLPPKASCRTHNTMRCGGTDNTAAMVSSRRQNRYVRENAHHYYPKSILRPSL